MYRYSTFQSYILNSEKDISHMLVFSLREQRQGYFSEGFFVDYRQFPFSSSSFSKKIAEHRSKNRALRFFFFFRSPIFPPGAHTMPPPNNREFTPPQQFGFSPPPFSRLRRRERSRDEPNVASPSPSLSISGHLFSRFLHSGRGAISHPPPLPAPCYYVQELSWHWFHATVLR